MTREQKLEQALREVRSHFNVELDDDGRTLAIGYDSKALQKVVRVLDAALSHTTGAPLSARFSIDHDGFVGTVIGYYRRHDGKRGVVLQQDGTKVVHVYGEKWLKAEKNQCPTI